MFLPERNAAVSPFFSLLMVAFPLYELLRSIVRRIATNGARPFEPDDKHLHSLMFRVLTERTTFQLKFQNSLAASIILLLPLGTSLWAVINFNDRDLLIIGIFGFVGVYEIANMILSKLCIRSAASCG